MINEKIYYEKINHAEEALRLSGLSLAEEAAYWRLRRACNRSMQSGIPTPTDDKFLCNIIGVRGAAWKQIKENVLRLFDISSGFLVFEPSLRNFEEAKISYQKRADAAKVRHSKNKALGSHKSYSDAYIKSDSLDVTNSLKNNDSISAMQEHYTCNNNNNNNKSYIYPSTTISDTTTTSLNAADVKKIEVSREKYKTVAEQVLHDCGDLPHLFMAPVLSWLENNCDPELDIFPTIRMAFAKNPNLKIRSLTYFDQPIMNAKAIRLRQLPSPKENHYENSKSAKPNRYLDAMARTNF